MDVLSLLFATLIGVFITPHGIVVGADTAVSNRTGQISTRQKYCVTGPQSVATLQGVYELIDTETKATLTMYDSFLELCAKIDREQLPPTLLGKGIYITDRLSESLTRFLMTVPPAEVVRRYATSPVVARIAVSGYDNGEPASVVLELGIATDVKRNEWGTRVRTQSRLSFKTCGVRFHGQDSVLAAARSGTDVRIPRTERLKPEVASLSALIRGDCSGLSIASAPASFKESVRLTVEQGRGFGIPPGAVNLPLDIVIIPNAASPETAGPIEIRRFEAW